MPKHTSSGAPKKARWSAEKKSAAIKKPHRGQGGPKSTGSFSGPKSSRPASSGSSHVGGREWRAPRDEHRSSDRRDDRGDRGFQRRDDRGDRGFQRREDRPSFDRRDDRGGDRGGYQRRDDRGDRGFQRRDDGPSFDRRDDRGGDQRRDERGDRGFQRRDYRPSFDRRDDRGGYQRRDDRGDRGFQRRDDRPSFDRRNDRGADRVAGQAPVSFEDAEAERMDADNWTKATRADVSDGPVDVAADNGFAALGLPERIVERLAREGITSPFPIQTAT